MNNNQENQFIKAMAEKVISNFLGNGIDLKKTCFDQETKTLIILGTPLLSATQKIHGDLFLNTKALSPDTLHLDAELGQLAFNHNLLARRIIEAEISKDFIDANFEKLSNAELDSLPSYIRDREQKYFYPSMASLISSEVVKMVNLSEKLDEITDISSVVDQEFFTLVSRYFPSGNQFKYYLNALCIRDSIKQLQEVNMAALNVLYYVFRLYNHVDHFISDDVSTHEEFMQGDFIKAGHYPDLNWEQQALNRFKLENTQSWTWLLTKATPCDFSAINSAYGKNDGAKESMAYNNFDFCRHSIAAMAALKTPLSQELREAILKYLISDNVQLSNLGFQVEWEDYYNKSELLKSGVIFKKGLEHVLFYLARFNNSEKQIIQLIKDYGETGFVKKMVHLFLCYQANEFKFSYTILKPKFVAY